ncbi:hypothetical protein D9611_008143 [Ephemerocybe angulata]|uniref:DNA 3'-5' helicase n=1 Tax=Ephemerocybe angulata TaxID=980116 RepID=A0A8H5FDB3_9AGAR|nr:hypothetical protein D9611_008143 [Tulosesus angulatus]
MSGSFSAADYADDDEIEEILRFTERVAQFATQFASPESNKTTRNDETGVPSPPGKRINYHADAFDWDRALLANIKATFNIPDFRLCQRGVCNANLDGRDIICTMPTGGRTSLTYQLPALLNPGVTVVVCPFIDRIEDRVMSMSSCNVESVMLLGTTEDEEKNRIYERLLSRGDAAGDSEIKLCYVTPLTIAKDNEFLTIFPNFRSDYGKLRVLKNSLPEVPIMALSAMCLPKVLKDIINVLQLPPIVPGEDANTKGTVYFTVDGDQPWEVRLPWKAKRRISTRGVRAIRSRTSIWRWAPPNTMKTERFLAEPRAPPQLESSCEEDDIDEAVSEQYNPYRFLWKFDIAYTKNTCEHIPNPTLLSLKLRAPPDNVSILLTLSGSIRRGRKSTKDVYLSIAFCVQAHEVPQFVSDVEEFRSTFASLTRTIAFGEVHHVGLHLPRAKEDLDLLLSALPSIPLQQLKLSANFRDTDVDDYLRDVVFIISRLPQITALTLKLEVGRRSRIPLLPPNLLPL